MLDVHSVVYAGFVALPIAIAVLIARAAHSTPVTCGIVVWMLLSAALAQSGILSRFSAVPPPIALLVGTGFLATIGLGMSRAAGPLMELPWAILIGVQSFRIVVEILIHASFTAGVAPVQMTWSGYNFDIVTGVTALAIAPFATIAPARLLFVWNCMGLALLSWVVGIAMISVPTRFQLMRPANTWVVSFPYVWLPTVLVTAALLGHIVVFRKLANRRVAAGEANLAMRISLI